MARYRLDETQLQAALHELPQWEVRAGKLHRTFTFDTFGRALGWMISVGIEADKMDHHPEWCNVYNRVTVDLVTHDMDNSISNLDVRLAQKMDALAS